VKAAAGDDDEGDRGLWARRSKQEWSTAAGDSMTTAVGEAEEKQDRAGRRRENRTVAARNPKP